MKILPFDIDLALKHPDRVYTKAGQHITDWHYFSGCTGKWPIAALDPDKFVVNYTKTGQYCIGQESDNDLVLHMEPIRTPLRPEQLVGASIRRKPGCPASAIIRVEFDGDGDGAVFTVEASGSALMRFTMEELLTRGYEYTIPGVHDWRPCYNEE